MIRLPQRFQEMIQPEPLTGCWLWSDVGRRYGYARVTHQGRRAYAHRVVWELLVGPIEDGKELDHLCRVTCCVNPSHLDPVVHSVNWHRGSGPAALANDVARRRARTHCLNGHPFAGENLQIRKDGARECRTCQRRRLRDWARANRKRRTLHATL